MDFIKKYWWAILVMIIIPILVNGLLSISTSIKVYENGWLGFWGSYLGALFPFVILYLSLRDNRRENEKERNIQTAIIEYQVSKDYQNTLKKDIADYINALNLMEMELLAIKAIDNTGITLNKLYMILTKSDNAFQKLNLTLSDYDDNTEIVYKDFLNNFNTAFKRLISDIAWLMDNYNNEDGIKAIESYRDFMMKGGKDTYEFLRIWKVIEDSGYQLTDVTQIIQELLDRIEYRAISMKSQDFIRYEKEKMEKTLYNVLNQQL